MGRGRLGNWRSLAAVAGIAVVVAWLLYLLYRSPHRDDLSTYGAFVFPVAAVVVGWLAWAWRKGKASQSAGATGSEDLDHFADRLAAAVQAQWKTAAEERGLTGTVPIPVGWSRPSDPVSGPTAAAVNSHRFRPLPGLAQTEAAELTAGQIGKLHAVYGGLRSGRLIIAGPTGSGKSGAAVLLLLAALRYRTEVPAERRAEVPVPVLFTAQDWDPQRQSAVDWLTGKLQGTYPLTASTPGAAAASALLASGRITVILDGLDEVSPELRPVALQALSRQATFRLVILSRTREIAAAAADQGVLQGAAAVELNPVDPDAAASYLERTQLDPPPPGWRELTARIRAHPGSPLGAALDSPLALTLVRDTYQGENVRELLEFCDTALDGMPPTLAAEAITDHLLDRLLPAAYRPTPGQPLPPYDLATAQRALIGIAAQMDREGTRDLNWWEIPNWAPSTPRVLVAGLLYGLAAGLAGGITGGLAFGIAPGLLIGLGSGLMFACIAGFEAGRKVTGADRPRTAGALHLGKALRPGTLVVGLTLGLWTGGAVTGVGGGLVPGLVTGLTVMIAGGTVFGLEGALAADSDNYSSLNPVTSWRSNRSYGRAVGCAAGLVAGIAAGITGGLAFGLAFGLASGIALGLLIGLELGMLNTDTWVTLLASAQLANEWDARIRLMRFLDDAYSRNVLRAVGPSYQFRHARLQDRLAAGEPARTRDRSDPDQQA